MMSLWFGHKRKNNNVELSKHCQQDNHFWFSTVNVRDGQKVFEKQLNFNFYEDGKKRRITLTMSAEELQKVIRYLQEGS